MAGPGVGVVVAGDGADLAGGIVLVEPGRVAGAAGAVIMAEAVEAPDAVARDPGRGAVAAALRAGQALGPPRAVEAAVVVGRGEPERPAERVAAGFEPGEIGVDDPGAERGGIIFKRGCIVTMFALLRQDQANGGKWGAPESRGHAMQSGSGALPHRAEMHLTFPGIESVSWHRDSI